MVDKIIKWIIELATTLYKEVAVELISSLVLYVISFIIEKTKALNNLFTNFMRKILKSKKEKTFDMTYIDSPCYSFISSNKKTNGIFDDPMIIMIVSIIFASSLYKYTNEVTTFIKWYGLIPLLISIALIFVIAITRNVQKITLKFICFTILISTLTLYYGVNIEKFLKLKGVSLQNIKGNNLQSDMYIILGLITALLQQWISYLLLFRTFSVYVIRKKKKPVHSLEKFIYNTRNLEKIHILVILTIIFSSFSFLLTLDCVHEYLLKLN